MNKPVILISGANSYIGSKLAQFFVEDGYSVLLLVHNSQHNIQHLLESKDHVFVTQCDLSNWEETNSAVQKLISESNLIPDALIHTATVRSKESLPLVDTDPIHWAEIIHTNVISAYHIIKAVLPMMQKQKQGRIVLFGSDVSRSGLAMGTAYSASKSAISNLAKSLSLELADTGILINTVSPGPVETDNEHFDLQYQEFRKSYFQKQLLLIPLKRHAQISDIYPLCKFLVSESNSYITGEEIFLTGGKH
jgi:NAD(P)-dependent dehydrogenase (short-subunit alcohol dehydrogenase family)